MKDTIDIRFRGENLEKRLSNLYPYQFDFDGITYASMEAFLDHCEHRISKKSKSYTQLMGWTHSVGKTSKNKTLLTRKEFIS